MISRRYRARHRAGSDELNITAFMNLMVVLVPFLLLSAVFSRLTILQLNLPGDSVPTAEVPTLQLEVIVGKDSIDVADRRSGLLKRLPHLPSGLDYRGLNDYLQVVKAQYPDKTDATILLQPETAYDVVVQTMDAVRSFTVVQGGTARMAELFPEISIGDAPAS
jgi:biopolymer transport protein ExbD